MKETKDYFALIMAGGVGSRFWPTSRSAFPKQFQDLTGSGKTLLQQTYDRLDGWCLQNKFMYLPTKIILPLSTISCLNWILIKSYANQSCATQPHACFMPL